MRIMDDSTFQKPDSMEKAIVQYCENHGQPVPCRKDQLVRCVLTSILGGSVLPPLQASIIDLGTVFGMPSVNVSLNRERLKARA